MGCVPGGPRRRLARPRLDTLAVLGIGYLEAADVERTVNIDDRLLPLVREAADIAHHELAGGHEHELHHHFVAQIERYQRETGCDHVHAAFGAGLPATDSERSTSNGLRH